MRVRWSEIERVQRAIGKVQGRKLSDELLLFTAKGRFTLPYWRIQNADEVMAYAGPRLLPPSSP